MKYKILEPFDEAELKEIQNTMFLTLILTQACNLNCEYCDVLEDVRKTRKMTVDDAQKIIDFIEYQDYKMPNLVIHFFGGEPTLNDNLDDIVKLFKDHFKNKRNIDYLITTNLHDDSTVELDQDLIYAASFHSDKISELDMPFWFDRAKLLWANFQLHHVVLMLHDDNMELIEQLYLKYGKQIPCIIAPITQFIGTELYEKYKYDFVEKHKIDPFDDGEHELFFGLEDKKSIHMCRAGFIIDEFGNVYNCWNEYHQPPNQNIFQDPKVKMPIWHPCTNYSSNCDMEVPRSSISYFNQHFKGEIPKPEGIEYDMIELRKYKPKRILFRCNG